MKDFINTELEELKDSELKEIGGGDKFLRDLNILVGKIYGKLCSLASFEDSNSVNEGYVGRGM